jgi:hypothetical protein
MYLASITCPELRGLQCGRRFGGTTWINVSGQCCDCRGPQCGRRFGGKTWINVSDQSCDCRGLQCGRRFGGKTWINVSDLLYIYHLCHASYQGQRLRMATWARRRGDWPRVEAPE